ncbi:DNA-directed RNA polymerase [Enterobacter ludwigii]|uniref:DNA-directed RNA polymerase n=1 Tax=Enterobacter ludwigii TaxID=299767 RepID=UPI003BEF3F38
MSNAFNFGPASEFARKAALDSILPAIGVALHHKECGFENEQYGLAALAIYTALSYLPDTECKVDNTQMIEYMAQAIEHVHTLNRDLKEHYITHSPAEMLAIATALGWMKIDNYQMNISNKWIQLTTSKNARPPVTEVITDATRRVPYVKYNKVPPSKPLKVAEQFLADTAYHVESKISLAMSEYLDQWKQDNINSRRMNAKLPTKIEADMYVHKGSEMFQSEEVLYSEYSADVRGRLYHAACFGPNPQSGDMARAYYSHNVENWVEKGSTEYDIFMTELADVAGSDIWLKPANLRAAAKHPAKALDKLLKRDENGEPVPSKIVTYVRMAMDWAEFEDNGKCDSRLGYGEDAKCSGTQILAILAGSQELVKATGFRTEDGKSPDPYVVCLDNIKALLKRNPLQQYITPEAMEKVLTRDFAKKPYMSVQYGGGEKALMENKDFIACLNDLGLDESKHIAFVYLTLEAVKRTLGNRINNMITAIQNAVELKLEQTGKKYFTYRHIDGLKVNQPCFKDGNVISSPFSIRVGASLRVNFGNVKTGKAWEAPSREPEASEFVRTFVVNYVQGIDALIARTVAVKAKEAGLRGFTSIHDCFRVCLADASKLHKVIADAYKEIFIDNDPLKHLSEQLGGIQFHAEKVLTEELIYSEHSYFFTP